MPARNIVKAAVGIVFPVVIVLILSQVFIHPFLLMMVQIGIDAKLFSIGLLSATNFFLWRIVSGFINQESSLQLNSDDLNQLWMFLTTLLFGLGLGSLAGLFANGYGFLIGLISGGLLGYQAGFHTLSAIRERHLPLLLLVIFAIIPLFGVIVLLSLYLSTNLGFLLGNLVVGSVMGAFLGYISIAISRLNRLSGLISVVGFSLLFAIYVL